jgi:hypothetical protein
MKIQFTPLVLALVTMTYTQDLSAQAAYNQALSKYSYPIFTVVGGQQRTGTAFFYKSGDTSYLVSNYHAIKGMNPLKKVINFTTDTLYLKYTIKNTHDLKVVPIDISAETTGTTEIFSMVDRIDLLKVAVNLPGDADVYYINDLIDERYLNEEPEEVIVFGYPTNPGSIPAFYSRQQRLQGQVNPDGFMEYDSSLKINFPSASDSARAIMGATARYYYFIRPYAAQGYSGAPVFGKFRTENNETVYRFTGVIFAGQPTTRQTWAIKGRVALNYLQGVL